MIGKFFRVLICACVLTTAGIVMASASSDVTGSVFRHNPAGSTPLPAAGDRLYLCNASASCIGPVYADDYGRYAFYDITEATYLLRVYEGGTQVWQQAVTAPAIVPPIVVNG